MISETQITVAAEITLLESRKLMLTKRLSQGDIRRNVYEAVNRELEALVYWHKTMKGGEK